MKNNARNKRRLKRERQSIKKVSLAREKLKEVSLKMELRIKELDDIISNISQEEILNDPDSMAKSFYASVERSRLKSMIHWSF